MSLWAGTWERSTAKPGDGDERPGALKWMPAKPWSEKASQSIGSLVTFGRDCMAVRLKELFAEGETHEGQVARFKRR